MPLLISPGTLFWYGTTIVVLIITFVLFGFAIYRLLWARERRIRENKGERFPPDTDSVEISVAAFALCVVLAAITGLLAYTAWYNHLR